MSWNKNGGPSDQSGPWGNSPGSSGPSQPDPSGPAQSGPLQSGPWNAAPPPPRGSAIFDQLRAWAGRRYDRFRNNGLGVPGGLIFVLIAVGLWLVSGYYTVGPNQVGLNLVFGKYVGKTLPGLRYNWPFPIGSVDKLNVTDRNAFNVGFVTRPDFSRPNATSVVDVPEESLMLTGDDNIADVKFVVFWQIDPAHPQDYAFNLADQTETVKAVAESAMREIIGHSLIQKILTAERKVIEPAVQQLMQKVLNGYNAGVLVLQVQLQSVDPPDEVIASFRDVTASQQDQAKLRNEGEAYANTVVPKARGQAAAIVQKAEGYRLQTVAEAQGQAALFDQVHAEYRKAPEVTRERLYLETMERILGRAPKLVVDDPTGKGVLPYLALPSLSQGRGP